MLLAPYRTFSNRLRTRQNSTGIHNIYCGVCSVDRIMQSGRCLFFHKWKYFLSYEAGICVSKSSFIWQKHILWNVRNIAKKSTSAVNGLNLRSSSENNVNWIVSDLVCNETEETYYIVIFNVETISHIGKGYISVDHNLSAEARSFFIRYNLEFMTHCQLPLNEIKVLLHLQS